MTGVAVLLDTDHLSVMEWNEQPACSRLLARLDSLPADDMATSIVSFHEQVQGWLAYLNKVQARPDCYCLLEARKNLARFPQDERPLLYSRVQERFAELKRQCPRLKTMDLRIASIALTTDSVLLTRNLGDFRQVPGLSVEDWTAS